MHTSPDTTAHPGTAQSGIPDQPEHTSLGERLLPYFFATMEACLVTILLVGLAGFNVFQFNTPLLPLWAPFILLIGSLWLFRFAQHHTTRQHTTTSEAPGTALITTTAPTPRLPPKLRKLLSLHTLFVLPLLTIITLLVIWASVYAQTMPIFDLNWLTTLLHDILQLSLRFFYVVSIIVIALYLYLRSVRLSHLGTDNASAVNTLRIGVVLTLLMILARTIQSQVGITLNNGSALLLLIPAFLFLALVTNGLAQAIYIRSYNFAAMQGSILVQERSIVLFTGTMGLIFLLITLLVASGGIPSSAATLLATAYDRLFYAFVYLVTFLLTPIYWLLSLLFHNSSSVTSVTQKPRDKTCWQIVKVHGHSVRETIPCSHPKAHTQSLFHLSPAALLPFLKIILPILLVLLIVLLIRQALIKRQQRIRLVTNFQNDMHESVWSWQLFWSQIKAIIRTFFQRFFPHADPNAKEQTSSTDDVKSASTARTIREIYRTMLKRAARHGYPRQQNETPYEFNERLATKTPLAEPRIVVITEAYITIRYGGTVPDEAEVARIRMAWIELEKQWHITASTKKH